MNWSNFVASFVSMLVAMNLVGVLPIYFSLVSGRTKEEKKKIINVASLTVILVTISFVVAGKFILVLIGITTPDFLIASGLVLIVAAIMMFLELAYTRDYSGQTIATVPLGTPLLAGPGLLTTTLMLSTLYGYKTAFASLFVNVMIVWIVLRRSDFILKIIRVEGMKAFSKIASLLLAGLGVMILRKGIEGIVQLLR